MFAYAYNATHSGYCKQALESVLSSGNLNLRERRKVKWVLENDRRLAKITTYVGMGMAEAYENAGYATSEFGSFIDTLQSWIDFIIENQDKIMQIINFFTTVILPLFVTV